MVKGTPMMKIKLSIGPSTHNDLVEAAGLYFYISPLKPKNVGYSARVM